MKIKHSDFINGGEVDFGAWHYEVIEEDNGFKHRKNFSLRLRKKEGEERVYEVCKSYHVDRSVKVELEGTLEECVNHINQTYSYADEVVR